MKKKKLILVKNYQKQSIRNFDHQITNLRINEYSVKCLGSYIGLEESIKSEFKKKSIQLEIEKDKLLQLQDNQCRQLLMTYCFANKCMYLARTLSPNITKEIFEDNYIYQNEIFHSLLLLIKVLYLISWIL